MEPITFQAVDVPRTFKIDSNTNFLIENLFTDAEGLTVRIPMKINLADLLSNIFSNTFDSLITPVTPPNISMQNVKNSKKKNNSKKSLKGKK